MYNNLKLTGFNESSYMPEAPKEPSIRVSEEQLLEAKRVEDASKFFHSEDKGCEIEEQNIRVEKGWHDSSLKIKYCKTHDCDCCRCGWQKGFHYGNYSKKLMGVKDFDDKGLTEHL